MNKLLKSSNIRPTHCANCGTTLQGSWCHVCGQSSKHVLRHLPDMLDDALELLFHLNGRVMKTLPTLYFFPGRLTREYVAGRRVRYVTPFRLMFVLCLLSFFFLHVSLRQDAGHASGNGAGSLYAAARTPAAVLAALDEQLAQIRTADAGKDRSTGVGDLVDMSRHALEAAALDRMQQLLPDHPPRPAQAARIQALARDSLASAHSPASLQHRLSAALAVVDASAVDDASRATQDRQLKQQAGARLAQLHAAERAAPATSATATTGLHGWYLRHLARLKTNLTRIGGSDTDRERMVGHVFRALPQSMLVLVPVFALLLQLLYLFHHRLYMEHLIVSLHSHAFLFLSLLILVGLGALQGVLPDWAVMPVGWLRTLVWLWIPVYLLLMQKRVYDQGWGMTILKYMVTGTFYVLLLSVTVAGAALVGLAG